MEYRPYCSRDAGDDAHLDAPLTPKDGHLRTSPTLAVAWRRALLIVARVRGRSTTSATTTASSASRSSRSITTHSICSTTARRASSRGRGASGPGTGTRALAAVRDARRTPHRAWRSSDAASASSPGTAGEHVCDVGRPQPRCLIEDATRKCGLPARRLEAAQTDVLADIFGHVRGVGLRLRRN